MMTFVVLGYRKVLVATGQAMFLSCTQIGLGNLLFLVGCLILAQVKH